jgi:hypothetical protein
MYVTSLYFQDPDGLGMTPLQARLATLPPATGSVLMAPHAAAACGVMHTVAAPAPTVALPAPRRKDTP